MKKVVRVTKCPYCKEQVGEDASVCPYCAESIETGKMPAARSEGQKPGGSESALSDERSADGGTTSEGTAVEVGVPPSFKEKRENYILRHWRGDLSLGLSYWVNLLLGSLLVFIMANMLAAKAVEVSLKLVATLTLVLLGSAIVVSVWQLVGVWRSAAKHVSRGGRGLWSTLARVMVVLGALKGLGMVFKTYVPQATEMLNIIAGDKKMPPYTVRILPGGMEMEFRGGLRAGSANEFERILNAAPQVKVLHINSTGGRVSEARKMMAVVRAREMTTYTSERCLSAATLVLMAGKERVVGPGAKIGFHAGRLSGATVGQKHRLDVLVTDIMRSAGASEEFIQRVLATSAEQMWYPTFEEMLNARIVTTRSLGER